MQLELTEDQSLLLETTVRFVEAELPLSRTRELHDLPAGYDRTWLQRSAELGWFAMLVPEEDGGGSVSGEGLLDAALLAEVLGRHVQPVPFLPANVVAATLAAHGSQRIRAGVLRQIIGGERIVTWAFADDRGRADDGVGVTAARTAAGITLTGTRGYVQEAQSADLLLITATIDGTSVQVLVPTDAAGVTMRPLASLDLSRRFAHVDLQDVTLPADSLVTEGTRALEEQLQVGLVLLLAETVGAMDALFEMTITYAKERIAFGRPIGSFQSIKHILADQALYLETCKAGAVAAAEAVTRRDEAAAAVVSMAAAYIGEHAPELAQVCLQIHGGIGFTWEHDLHLLMRRIQSNAVLYGEASWHRERVCAFFRLGEEPAP